MAGTAGRFSPAVRSKRYGAFSLQMQPTERLSAKMERSSRTTDGGAHWLPQISGTPLNLRAVSFTDGTSGTAVGEGGVIVKTTNGGSTWAPQSSGTLETLFGVSFSDSNTGTAVGGTFGKSEIFRTTDGGEHWSPQANPGTQFLFDVSFTDTNNGTAVGDSGTILRTTDGGNSWVPQTSGTTKTLYGVSFTDTNNGTVVGFEFGGTGIILRTTDGGNNWVEQTSYSLPQGANSFYGVSFSDGNTRNSCWRSRDHSSNHERWRTME